MIPTARLLADETAQSLEAASAFLSGSGHELSTETRTLLEKACRDIEARSTNPDHAQDRTR